MTLFSRFFGTPSLEQFAEQLADSLRASGVCDAIAIDLTTSSIRIGDEAEPRVINLNNFYQQFLRTGRKERDDYVRGVVRRFRTTEGPGPLNFHDARQRLLPAVRSRCYYTFSNLTLAIHRSQDAGERKPELAPFRLVANDLAVGLVLDYDETMRAVSRETLESWGVDEQTAMDTALGNLRARTDPQFQQHASKVWVSTWNDSYDATRILLPDVITALPVVGRHTVLAPNRNLLLVTGDMDPAGLEAMADLASTAFDEPQPVSATPLVWDGSWTELTLRDDHPAASAFAFIRMQLLDNHYAQQKQLLEALAARRGEDIFYASFMARKHGKTGEVASYSTWNEGVVQCLPETDRIVFVRDGADNAAGFATWPEVARVMGDALQPTDHYPRRFMAEGFPTEEQMQEMGVRAV